MNIDLLKLKLKAYRSPFNIGQKGIAFELIKLYSKQGNSKKETYLDLGCRNADLILAVNKLGLFKKIVGSMASFCIIIKSGMNVPGTKFNSFSILPIQL